MLKRGFAVPRRSQTRDVDERPTLLNYGRSGNLRLHPTLVAGGVVEHSQTPQFVWAFSHFISATLTNRKLYVISIEKLSAVLMKARARAWKRIVELRSRGSVRGTVQCIQSMRSRGFYLIMASGVYAICSTTAYLRSLKCIVVV